MKLLRYPILFLAVVLVPTSLASIFNEILTESTLAAIVGYLTGYVLIHLFMRAANRSFKNTIYSKRMSTTYLITNAVIALLLFTVLQSSIAILYANQPLHPTAFIIFVGLPWVSVQMLLLLFFVRSESVYH